MMLPVKNEILKNKNVKNLVLKNEIEIFSEKFSFSKIWQAGCLVNFCFYIPPKSPENKRVSCDGIYADCPVFPQKQEGFKTRINNVVRSIFPQNKIWT